ncbi:MAG: GH92 family glycosyl hydrolase [Ferruginibacter sp.]
MKKILCLCILNTALQSRSQQLIQYVQPLSGTAPATTLSALKHSEAGSEKNANTIPAVTLPFAMTQWTPQTRQTENKCIPPYYYKDSLFTGFRGSHWISGSCTQDYGSFTIMPVAGKLNTRLAAYAVPFSHENETTNPAFYSLQAGKLQAAVTATQRCSILSFTLLQDDSLYLLVMPNSDREEGFVKADMEKGIVWGYNPVHRIYQGWGNAAGFNGWFYMQIQKVNAVQGVFRAGNNTVGDSITHAGSNAGVYLGFAMKKGETLLVKTGTSFCSMQGAAANLNAEIPGWDFKQVETAAREVWEQELGKIRIQTTSATDKKIFYTAMYHALQHPRLYNDADGSYPAFSGNSGLKKINDGNYYDDFSMWDIYRAQLPLLTITHPGETNDFVRSMILKGQQGGWLPIFPCWNSYTAAMIGDHVTAFIASVFNRGIRNYDVQAAYALMRKNAFEAPADFNTYKNGMGRRALSSYLRYGFIPMEDSVQEAFHKKEQVSRTLEYAYDDYALSTMAKALHKAADYALLQKRGINYVNVFDRKTGMMRGRYRDGSWYSPFKADSREPYITEGTPRQYTFYVPQDIPGLARLMGGKKIFELQLDSLFLKNEYWHGNEPGHQIPFLYNYTASPWKTQLAVQKILKEEYSDGPGGLSGNDDAGQMSAWYIFAAIGFYPVDPVAANYQLCAPAFDEIVLSVPGGKQTIIRVHKKNPSDNVIRAIKWNGIPFNRYQITHQMLLSGGTLDIWLGSR